MESGPARRSKNPPEKGPKNLRFWGLWRGVESCSKNSSFVNKLSNSNMKKKIIQLLQASVECYAIIEKDGHGDSEQIMIWALVEDSAQNRSIEGITLSGIVNNTFISEDSGFSGYSETPYNHFPANVI